MVYRGGLLFNEHSDWKLKKGQNFIYLCKYASPEEWPMCYSRVCVSIKTDGHVVFMGQAPDLDNCWQAVILSDCMPPSLRDKAAMSLGFHYMGREKAVGQLEREDESVQHVHKVNVDVLDSWRLTAAKKVLLGFNSSLTRNWSCPRLTTKEMRAQQGSDE